MFGTVIIVALLALLLVQTFMVSRRQKKQREKIQSLQAGLAPGQKVVTAGGVHGTVIGVDADSADLQIARGVVVTFDKLAIIRSEA